MTTVNLDELKAVADEALEGGQAAVDHVREHGIPLIGDSLTNVAFYGLLARWAKSMEHAAVVEARGTHSWNEVGAVQGISGEAARLRHGRGAAGSSED